MARRTKRPRVVWLPPTNLTSVGQRAQIGFQTFFVDAVGATGASAVGEIPLVIDDAPDIATLAPLSLSDVENSGYRLRRVVGKIWCGVDQDADVNSGRIGIVTAGLIIRKVDPTTQISNAFNVGENAVSPAFIESWSDPWIWRRSWLLYNNANPSAADGEGPVTNIEYGSVMDGPHVDAKTARIVGPEERLFLDVSVVVLVDGAEPVDRPISVRCTTDLRALASMRVTSGNRRNASR